MKTRKMYIQYFTGKVCHTAVLDVPNFGDHVGVSDFRELINSVAAQAIVDFKNEGGTHEKTQAQRFRCQ